MINCRKKLEEEWISREKESQNEFEKTNKEFARKKQERLDQEVMRFPLLIFNIALNNGCLLTQLNENFLSLQKVQNNVRKVFLSTENMISGFVFDFFKSFGVEL